MISRILDVPPKVGFRRYLQQCSMLRDVDTNVVHKTASHLIAQHKKPASQRANGYVTRLESRWYASLESGKPDYAVYDSDEYLGDLWACWVVYSRGYLREIQTSKSLSPHGIVGDLGNVTSVVDLGCGIGLTTAALTQIFPQATVYGTNLPDIRQTRLAESVGSFYGFTIHPDIEGIVPPVDLIFASEYFEHIQTPIEHLREVIETLKPKAMLIANTFTSRSTGHFNEYIVDSKSLSGKATSRAFNDFLRRSGYIKVQTKLWNNRPAYWKQTNDRS